MVKTQDRITRFIASHSKISKERVEELMLNPTELVKDVGTMLEGEDAVKEGIIDEVGGIKDAFLQIIYEDPTASERTLSALAEFGFVMLGISLALGLVHMAVRLIRR